MSETPRPAKGPRLERLHRALLRLIAEGGARCRQIEEQLTLHPPPAPETIVRIYQALILRSVLEALEKPERLAETRVLTEMLLDWLRLEEKRKDHELAREKHLARLAHDQASRPKPPLTPEALAIIEGSQIPLPFEALP